MGLEGIQLVECFIAKLCLKKVTTQQNPTIRVTPNQKHQVNINPNAAAHTAKHRGDTKKQINSGEHMKLIIEIHEQLKANYGVTSQDFSQEWL